jgi:hypothetical protein
MVLGRWFYSWILVAPDSLGDGCFVFPPLFVLFGTVPCGVAVEVLPASLSGACDLGSSPWFANDSNQIELGNRAGGDRNGVDDSDVEQPRCVASELGAELARMVSGRDGAETGLDCQEGKKWRVNLR